ncbi:sulfur-oxidizing protein SoxX [Burkholderiales bacterium]|nr:sulfur-oxidizing protein SoxX [Burkholderiales bacterium]
MKTTMLAVAGLTIMAGCAATTQLTENERQTRAEAMLKAGFSKGNKAMAERVVQQDETQALCSKYPESVPEAIASRIQESQQATIRYPASGNLMGDWRQGEKIAQDGWGMRFTDMGSPNRPMGGNCYACHQLAPDELSYGTLGPSLYQFGKARGYTDEVRRYVYGKVYNAKATNACSNMPRFGHNGILTEQQIKDVVALLMDPASPVNR